MCRICTDIGYSIGRAQDVQMPRCGSYSFPTAVFPQPLHTPAMPTTYLVHVDYQLASFPQYRLDRIAFLSGLIWTTLHLWAADDATGCRMSPPPAGKCTYQAGLYNVTGINSLSPSPHYNAVEAIVMFARWADCCVPAAGNRVTLPFGLRRRRLDRPRAWVP